MDVNQLKKMRWETVSLCFPTPSVARKAHDILERISQKTRLINGLKQTQKNLREYAEDMIELVERYHCLSTTAKREET